MADFAHVIDSLERRTLLAGDFSSLLTLGTPDTVQTVVAVDNDAAGNTYLAGTFEGTIDFAPGAATKNASSKNLGIYLAKYTPAGALAWVRTLKGLRDLQVSQMSVDDAGNVYFAGPFGSAIDLDPSAAKFTVRSNGQDDVYIGKLNSAGKFAWGGSIGGSFNDTVVSLSVTPKGQVFLAGHFIIRADLDPRVDHTKLVQGNATGNVYLLKLRTDGSLAYRRVLTGDADESWFVRIEGMTAGADGSIALAGYYKGKIDFNPGAGVLQKRSDGVEEWLLRLDKTGRFQWIKSYGRDGRLNLRSMEMDADGNVYMAGQFTDSPDFDPGARVVTLESLSEGTGIYAGDIFVQKFTRVGAMAWVRQIGSTNAELQLMDMALDASGNPVITGGFNGTVDMNPGPGVRLFINDSNSGSDFETATIDGANAFIEKLTAGGDFLWARRIGNDDSVVIGTAISVDPAGNIHTGGLFAERVDFQPGAGQTLRTADDNGEVFLLTLTT